MVFKKNQNGAYNQFYENMTHALPGDLVFSFADKVIKAIGVVAAPARTANKPAEFGAAGGNWSKEGWLVQVDYEELLHPIKSTDHMNVILYLLPDKYSPLQKSGHGNQGVYLAEVPSSMAKALLKLIGRQADMISDESETKAIQNRTDIPATQKQQLVIASLGQGQYRKNLEQI